MDSRIEVFPEPLSPQIRLRPGGISSSAWRDAADIGDGHGLKTHRARTLARGWLQSAPDWMAGCR